MTDSSTESIAALRANHDELEEVVARLTPEQLTGPSGASEWTVAQVLSHLGSGAEITLATDRGRASRCEPPARGQPDDLGPLGRRRARGAGGRVRRARRAARRDLLEALDAGAARALHRRPRASCRSRRPLSVASGCGSTRSPPTPGTPWPGSTTLPGRRGVRRAAARALRRGLGFLLGFSGKADQLAEPTSWSPRRLRSCAIDDSVTVAAGAARDARPRTFTGPLEAAVRLLSGRLKPEFTPAGVEVTGNVSLDDLRSVFPGY